MIIRATQKTNVAGDQHVGWQADRAFFLAIPVLRKAKARRKTTYQARLDLAAAFSAAGNAPLLRPCLLT